jgi:salicylate hydroxylase
VAPVWQRDGVVLLGDAAHPTLPFLAQGANMALEDAWTLADSLARATTQAEGLAAYATRRRPRVSKVIKAASRNAWKYHLRATPLRAAAQLVLKTGGSLAPGLAVRSFDWIYGYDVTA